MQPLQDPLAIPRRVLDVEDYIDVVRRHRAWILGPGFAGLVVSVVVAFLWPDTYHSSSLIRVIPPQVPESYVKTNITAEMSSRINSMAQAILSRNNLTNLVNTHKLYLRDQRRLPIEDIIENMRKDIKVSPVAAISNPGNGQQAIQAFRISFAYDNRMLAQKVCADLTSRFINENLTTRANQSVMTTEFVRDQLEDRRKKLEEIDKKLTAFRVQNRGRLPEELQANLTAMNMAEQRVANINAQMARATQEKMILEGRLSILKDQLRFANQPIPLVETQREQARSERLQQYERDIMNMETLIAALLEQYRETHPDVVRRRSELAVLKRQRDQVAKDEEAKKAEPAQARPNQVLAISQQRDVRSIEAEIGQTQTIIEAKRQEIETISRDVKVAQAAAEGYAARVQSVPLGEAKYDELIRERALLKDQFEEMARKHDQSRVATDLENRKQSEQLELLDPANLPQTPTDPNRWMIVGAGLAIGLIAGVVIAVGRELKDTSLKSLKDVRAYTQLTVLGSVPLLENDLVVRRRRRLTWLAWSTAGLAGILIMAGSIAFYFTNRS